MGNKLCGRRAANNQGQQQVAPPARNQPKSRLLDEADAKSAAEFCPSLGSRTSRVAFPVPADVPRKHEITDDTDRAPAGKASTATSTEVACTQLPSAAVQVSSLEMTSADVASTEVASTEVASTEVASTEVASTQVSASLEFAHKCMPEIVEPPSSGHQEAVVASAEAGHEVHESARSERLAAFRALVACGNTVAIELVLKIVRDNVRSVSNSKCRTVKLDALEKRIQPTSALSSCPSAESKDGLTCAVSALQAAGFRYSSSVDGQRAQELELNASTSTEPLHDLIRMLERTRGTYWTPTVVTKEEPEPDPDSWSLIVSPDSGGYVIKEADAHLWSQTFRRTGNEARTWRGGQTPRVTVTFMNLSTERLLFNWIDSRSLNPEEKPWGELRAGTNVDQHTFVSHAWVLRLENGAAVAGYVPVEPGPGAHHVVAVSRHRSMPTRLRFEDMAHQYVQRAREKAFGWRDTATDADERARRGQALPRRPESEQWGVIAYPPVSGMEVPESDAEVWSGTHRSVGMEGRTWRGAQTPKVELILVNRGPSQISVSWLDVRNNMRERWDYNIDPGQSRTQGTYIYHAFVFRDTDGRAVGGYSPMDATENIKHVVFIGPRAVLPQGAELQRSAQSFIV